MVAYVKTETTTENVATGTYKTKESEALTTKPKEAELLTCQQPTPRQIQEREVTKNATKLLTFNYNNMKTILDKINKAYEIEANKTELAKHEVNLALADDVKKAYTEAIAARKKAFDIMQKIKADTATALKQLNDIKAANQKALPIFDKYEAAAKELGLALPAEIKQQKENIQDGLKGALTSYSKTLESIKIS